MTHEKTNLARCLISNRAENILTHTTKHHHTNNECVVAYKLNSKLQLNDAIVTKTDKVSTVVILKKKKKKPIIFTKQWSFV